MIKAIRTNIIPTQQSFVKVAAAHELHLEAICVFAAIGFFLDQDTYWKDEKVLHPGSKHIIDENGKLLKSKPWFEWHYTPRQISFEQALSEFTELFETIMKEQTQNKKVILPLSGGLDSRTQAAALQAIEADVSSYSYAFNNGYPETNIAKQITNVCGFEFEAFKIGEGYLWKHLDTLFELNKGYSDFTSPRQMAFYHQYANMGDVFSLGHWGDVLFDSMDLPQLSDEAAVGVILKKILKRGGLGFANKLWNSWKLEGHFETYLKTRILQLLKQIDIENTNAKLRAFKSLYWAPRWTSVNLSIFSSQKPIALPYYDQRMCDFICSIPEDYLKDRQLQIAYIQKRNPKLATIEWQDQRPFNLNTFKYNKSPYNLPYKIISKLKRELSTLRGQPYVQRNWELQFLGDANKKHMAQHLFEHGLDKWIPKPLISNYFNEFYGHHPIQNAHAMNILLVLSQFHHKTLDG